MSKDAATIQEKCQSCQLSMEKEEIYAVFIFEDWRTPFILYLTQGTLPTDRKVAYRLKRLALRYFLQNGILFEKDIGILFKLMWKSPKKEKAPQAAVSIGVLLAHDEEGF